MCGSSPVGIGPTPPDEPHGHGNYFWFAGGRGLRCINFWAENLKKAVDLFRIPDDIEVVVITESRQGSPQEWALVVDPRIPLNWRAKRPCFTGGWGPVNPDTIQAIFDYFPDADNIQEYLDPESYQERQRQRWAAQATERVIVYPVKRAPKTDDSNVVILYRDILASLVQKD